MSGERQVIYAGEWVEGKMQGTGTYYFPNGDVYVGEWKEGNRHGKGQYTLKDGTQSGSIPFICLFVLVMQAIGEII